MNKIKSFIYLDYDKMYSLASQTFEGLVDSYIQSETENKSEFEEQKGPIASGKKLGDILRTERQKSESKFLHDYLYNLFESKLFELDKVKVIDNYSIDDFKKIENLNFIKVKGNAIFNDSKEMIKTISEFNNLGDTIAYMSLFSELQEAENLTTEELKKTKDKNHKSKIKTNCKSLTNNILRKYKDENNLHLDKEFLDKLQYALEYGYDDMFEVLIMNSSTIFSTILNRNYLKEHEKLLISKYSRETEVDITLFGLVTQTYNYTPSSTNDNDEDLQFSNFKEAFRNLINNLKDVENTFIGKSYGEIIIDPIALYIEI